MLFIEGNLLEVKEMFLTGNGVFGKCTGSCLIHLERGSKQTGLVEFEETFIVVPCC